MIFRIIKKIFSLSVAITVHYLRLLNDYTRKVSEVIFGLPFLYICCLYIRVSNRYFTQKNIDIGLGPEPLINNIYHKKALLLQGYTVETFVSHVYFITNEFDYRGDVEYQNKSFFARYFKEYLFFLRAVSRYKCIYIYFNGGPLFNFTSLRKYEPYLLKLTKTKVVVMPYGGDVNVMNYCPNLLFKHAMATDYPEFYKRLSETELQIRRWTTHADHVISGCDWVDYTYHWDTLTLAHFSIDVSKFLPHRKSSDQCDRAFTHEAPLRVLHAPNHKTIKGTSFFIKAVNELKAEGHPIELVLIQGKSNDEVIHEMTKVDVVADQLIVGWYAMFSLEAMSMGKPVICYLRKDLIELYLSSGNLASVDELPHINSDIMSIKNTFINILNGSISLNSCSEKGVKFVEKYHSIQFIGELFHRINTSIGIVPSGLKQSES